MSRAPRSTRSAPSRSRPHRELKQDYTIVIVTHNMQQASRVSDKTAFFNIAGAASLESSSSTTTRPHVLEADSAGHEDYSPASSDSTA